jgi:hypothetical protein
MTTGVLGLALLNLLSFDLAWAMPEASTRTKPDPSLELTLEEAVKRHVQTQQDEDLKAFMETIHTQSPVNLATKTQMPPLFEAFDFKLEILSLKFVGKDDDYAFVRTKIRTTKTSGAAFKNTDMDQLLIFRLEDQKWKLWNQSVLEFQFRE